MGDLAQEQQKLIIYKTVTRSSVSLKFLVAIIFCFVPVVLSTGTARGQKTDPLVGKWSMTSTTSDGDEIPWSLTFSYANGKYSATSSYDQGEGPVKDLVVEGSKIHFRVPHEGDDYDIDLKLNGGSLVGTWSGNGMSGGTKGHKAASS